MGDEDDLFNIHTLALASINKGLSLNDWQYVNPSFIFDFIMNAINISNKSTEQNASKKIKVTQDIFDNF